jgi:anti-sigma factor RsiW
MNHDDQLEFLISQYLDGSLSAPERKSLEARLARDPKLKQTLEEYAQLDELLRTGMPVPRDEWDDLGDRISSAVAELPDPRPSLRLMPLYAAATALAACVLLLVGLRFRAQTSKPEVATIVQPAPAPASAPAALPMEVAIAQVTGPSSETPSGLASADVHLGGPPSDAGMTFEPSQSIVSQPSHVYIASADASNDRAIH